jgi:hypothetical protein
MGDFAGTGHMVQVVSAVNHRHRSWAFLFPEPFSGIPNTNGRPTFHIPHTMAVTANQGFSKTPDKFENSNSRSIN